MGSSRVKSCESLSLVVPGGEVLMIDRHASWLDKEASDVLTQTSWPYQFSVLFRRMLTHTCKDRAKVIYGLGMEIFTGLVVGTVWFQQKVEKEKSIFPILGVFCMLTTIAVFDSFLNLILTFPLMRAVHFREYHNGYYHLVPYFCASMAVACLQSGVYVVVDAGIIFVMVGLPFTLARLAIYLGVCALGGCIGAALGFLVGCLTSDIQRMQQIVVPALLPLLIFSGYMIPLARMPGYLKWIYWGSFYQYMYSRYGEGGREGGEGGEGRERVFSLYLLIICSIFASPPLPSLPPFLPPSLSLVIAHFSGLIFTDCPTRSTESGIQGYSCKQRGEEVLAAMALSPDQLVRNVGVLLGTLALFLCLGYTALRYKSR